jgi:AcrR family transcriptional regulator
MSKSTTYHHGDLRNALLEAASAELEAEGADALSLRALARTLGVSHAAPAHHFPNRHALLAELAADGYAALADALEAAIAAASPEDRGAASGRAYVRFGLANPERYRLMFAGRLLRGAPPERLTAEADRAYLALLRTVYGEGLPAPDRAGYRMAAPELRTWALVHGMVMLRLDGQLDDLLDDATFLALVDRALAVEG